MRSRFLLHSASHLICSNSSIEHFDGLIVGKLFVGYTAHLIFMISKYLEIPFRFPIYPMCSRSTIQVFFLMFRIELCILSLLHTVQWIWILTPIHSLLGWYFLWCSRKRQSVCYFILCVEETAPVLFFLRDFEIIYCCSVFHCISEEKIEEPSSMA